jgi:homoserine O-acetyltransferase/O-succinyltransferase
MAALRLLIDLFDAADDIPDRSMPETAPLPIVGMLAVHFGFEPGVPAICEVDRCDALTGDRLQASAVGSTAHTLTNPFLFEHSYMTEFPTSLSPRAAMHLLLALLICVSRATFAADYPAVSERDVVLRDFRFTSGEALPELRMHCRTLGEPKRDETGIVRNAVLILHGTTGSGGQFIRPEFAGELFGVGQLLDATRFFIVLPDGIGHGKSSKPSDGLHAKFPRYGYLDMVEAQHRLLVDGLHINHLRLVLGTSMGGMHTWLWGELHPDFMDALMPLASLPTQVAGRNRAWRRLVIDAIRKDPQWHGGDYAVQPPSLDTAAGMLWLMSSNPVLRQAEAPTLVQADATLDSYIASIRKTNDANDVLYAVEASRDYDPGPALAAIHARLVAVNSADDLINPPELGILEREIKRVPGARAVVVPFGAQTRGHGSHTIAALWKSELAQLLQEPPAGRAAGASGSHGS